MLFRALLFLKVGSSPETSSQKRKEQENKEECSTSKIHEGFSLVNSFLKQDASICFLKPVTAADEVNYPPGTKFEMVEVWLDVASFFDEARTKRDQSVCVHVSHSNIDIVRRFVPENIEVKDTKGLKIPYDYDVVFCGRNLSVIEKLLQSGLIISVKHIAGRSTLAHYAVNERCTSLIPVLQRCGVDLNGLNSYGQTPLQIAVENEELEILKVLLDNGASPNAPSKDGYTALHDAVCRGFLAAVVALLENGADINATNDMNHTPVDLASLESNENLAIIGILLKNVVDFNSISSSFALLTSAIKHNEFELVQKLLEHGAKADQKICTDEHFPSLLPDTDDEISPLSIACVFADEKMIQLLLDHGADPNIKCKEDGEICTPLSDAVKRGSDSIVRLLLRNGVTVRSRQEVLISMIDASDPDGMEFLLKNGCDVDTEDSQENDGSRRKALVAAFTRTFPKKYIDMLMKYGASFKFRHLKDSKSDMYSTFDSNVLKAFLAYGFTDLEGGEEENVLQLLRLGDVPVDFWERDANPRRLLYAEILAKHLIKLKVAGKQINESRIMPPDYYSRFQLNVFRTICESEIELMKRKMVCETQISLYDVLTKDTKTVSRYLKNENIRLTLMNYQFKEEFPEYCLIIESRVRLANWRRDFFTEARKSFNWLVLRLPRLPRELKDDILDMLRIQDFVNLQLCFPFK